MAALNTSSGYTVETLARNIIRTVESATAEQRSDGLRWYSEAQGIARNLCLYAEDVTGSDGTLTLDRAAGIIAALSPRNTWSRNVDLAFAVVDGGDVATLSRSRDAALAIFRGAQPHDVLKGPKVRAFVEAIASGGERGLAVVDVWAVRAATRGQHDAVAKSRYADVALAYEVAARRLGIKVHHAQAIAWVVCRGGAS